MYMYIKMILHLCPTLFTFTIIIGTDFSTTGARLHIICSAAARCQAKLSLVSTVPLCGSILALLFLLQHLGYQLSCFLPLDSLFVIDTYGFRVSYETGPPHPSERSPIHSRWAPNLEIRTARTAARPPDPSPSSALDPLLHFSPFSFRL